jgi:hypothetical protein
MGRPRFETDPESESKTGLPVTYCPAFFLGLIGIFWQPAVRVTIAVCTEMQAPIQLKTPSSKSNEKTLSENEDQSSRKCFPPS